MMIEGSLWERGLAVPSSPQSRRTNWAQSKGLNIATALWVCPDQQASVTTTNTNSSRRNCRPRLPTHASASSTTLVMVDPLCRGPLCPRLIHNDLDLVVARYFDRSVTTT